MSIVRISALKGAIHGVTPNGAFVHRAYDRDTLQGRTKAYREPDTAGGGHDPLNPGDPKPKGRELRERGFPRAKSNLTHMLTSQIRPAIRNLGDQPVTVMIHGFLFDPRDSVSDDPSDSNNPHSRHYHFIQGDLRDEIRHHTTSWPLGLGYTEDATEGEDGLVLAYGWHSKPGFATSLITKFQNFYARAYENAGQAAWNLLTALHVLNNELPAGKKIDLFCHSLGSRVVIRLLAYAAKHGRMDILDRIDRVIIMGGAEYVVEARHMLSRLNDVGAADDISFYNIVSRENDVLDKLGENFGPRTFGNSNVIGHNGLDVEDVTALGNGWLDLQIDGRDLQSWMRDNRDMEVTGDNPSSVWDHWYYFTDPGNMAVYKAILRDRENWDISTLLAEGIPRNVSRRRSVFGTRPSRDLP